MQVSMNKVVIKIFTRKCRYRSRVRWAKYYMLKLLISYNVYLPKIIKIGSH